jgi:metal-responsive CopG/Arc/MetJ family transcriptional regulator
MGRPPLKAKVPTVSVIIRLPEDVLARVDELAGPNKRGEWVRDAIERRLKGSPPNRHDSKTSRSEE